MKTNGWKSHFEAFIIFAAEIYVLFMIFQEFVLCRCMSFFLYFVILSIFSAQDKIFLPLSDDNEIKYDTETNFTVPCRISNPELEVTYQVTYKDNPVNEYTEFKNGWNAVYDPKTGYFLYPKPDTERDGLSLQFLCQVTLSGKVSQQTFNLIQKSGNFDFISLTNSWINN